MSFATGLHYAEQQPSDAVPALPPKEKSPERISVSRQVLSKMIVSKQAAQYPPEAAGKNAEGPVLVAIVIDQDGIISFAQERVGYAVLGPAAIAAVKQWKFRPAVYQGKRVEVAADVVVDVPAPDRPENSGRLMIDADTAEAHLLNSPKPDYPSDIAITRIQGDVIVKCYVGTDGKVQKTKGISGHPMLIKTAEIAASKVTYTPYTKDGVPTEAVTYVVESVKPR